MGFIQYLRDHVVGPELLSRSETPPEQPPPGSGVLPPAWGSEAGPIDAKTALSLVPVFRSVQIISGMIANLSVDVERYSNPVSRPSWITRPDIKISRSEFLAQTATSMALRGNFYWRVVRDDPTTAPTALIVLNPLHCHPQEDGKLSWAKQDKPLQPWEFVHGKYLSIPGDTLGLGPLQAAQPALRNALTARDWGSKQLSDVYLPPGVLKTEQELVPEEAARYKAQWDNQAANGGTAVLGRGLSYERTLLTFEEVEWLGGIKFSTEEAFRLFGVPPRMGMYSLDGSSLTYANLQDETRTFLSTTLSSYYRPIEDAFSNLLPRGNTARFNLDALLRPNTTERYAAHATALSAGFMTIAEVREVEGLPPLPEPVAPPAPKKEEEVPNE